MNECVAPEQVQCNAGNQREEWYSWRHWNWHTELRHLQVWVNTPEPEQLAPAKTIYSVVLDLQQQPLDTSWQSGPSCYIENKTWYPFCIHLGVTFHTLHNVALNSLIWWWRVSFCCGSRATTRGLPPWKVRWLRPWSLSLLVHGGYFINSPFNDGCDICRLGKFFNLMAQDTK